MGFVSLKEDVDEGLRLAGLASEKFKSVVDAPSMADLQRVERMVSALLRRCEYIEKAMADIEAASSEKGPDAGNYVYHLRLEIEGAKETIARLEGDRNALKLKFEQARKRRKAPTRRSKTKGKRKLRTARAKGNATKAVVASVKPDSIRQGTERTELVGTIEQSFSHGRKKVVSVEKKIRRQRT